MAAPSAGDTPVLFPDRSNGVDMDALIKSLRPGKAPDLKSSEAKPATPRPAELDPSEFMAAAIRPDQLRPSRAEAEAAVQTLLSYIGENPGREGLLDTPRRVVEAFDELYQGYHQCPAEVLNRTFGETAGYDDFVLVRDIEFTAVRASHDAVLRQGAHRLHAGRACRRLVEARASDRYFRPPAADPGAPDRADRGCDR